MTTPSSRPSAQRLAQFLRRADCLWMASPSLALLSVFIVGKSRPTRLLVQEGTPSLVSNIGGLVGAVPELTTFDDSEDLRTALRGLGSSADRAWGIATHRPGALAPAKWFDAFAASRTPTVELCLGGLFQLARRGPTAATFTIVSLDDEPAFEGAHLTALLTNDSALAERVRDLCLGAGSDEAILDATPRGLAEDEPALLTLLETAIAREEAAFADAQKAPPQPAKGISLAWKRIFHSEPAEDPRTPEKSDPLPAPPRGQNPWLARIEAATQEHRKALDLANAALESARAENLEQAGRAQVVAGEWKARFEKVDSRATSLAEKLSEALDETRLLVDAHEKNLALGREREARLVAESEASRLSLSERVAALEASAALAQSQAAALEKEKAGLLEAARLASERHETLAEKLKQAQDRDEAVTQEHGKALDLANTALESARAENLEQAGRAQVVADEWKDRFEAADSRATSLAEKLRGALDETRLLAEAHEKNLALGREREARLVAESEASRRSLSERVAALEASAALARSQAAALEKDKAGLVEAARLASDRHETLAEKLKQAQDRDEAATQEHRKALDLSNTALESARAENLEQAGRAQVVADEWKDRFEKVDSRATSLAEKLSSALDETRLLAEAHEKNLALGRESEARLVAESEASRRAVSERVAALEASAALAQSQAAALEKEKAGLVEAARLASDRHETLAEKLKQAQDRYEAAAVEARAHASALLLQMQDERLAADDRFHASQETAKADRARLLESHAQALAALEAQIRILETDRDQVERLRKAAVADRDREATRLAAAAEAAEKVRLELVSGAQTLEAALAESLVRIEGLEAQSAKLLAQNVDTVAERDAATALQQQAEEAHHDALRLAAERADATERERVLEIARLNATVEDWHARFEASAEVSRRQADGKEAQQAAAAAGLEAQIAQLRKQAEGSDKSHRLEVASLAEQLSLVEREKAAYLAERDQALDRVRQEEEGSREAQRLAEERAQAAQRGNAEEVARLNATLNAAAAESQARLEATSLAARTRLQEELAGHQAQAVALAEEQAGRHLAIETQLSVLETEKANLNRDLDVLAERLREAEQGRCDAQQVLEDRVAAFEREKALEADRLSKEATSRQTRLEGAAKAAAKELQQVEARHAAVVARLQEKVSNLKKEGDAAAKEATSLSRQLAAAENEKASLSNLRDETEARRKESEERGQEALRLAEERVAGLRREADEAAGRASVSVAEWQGRLELTRTAAASESQRIEGLHTVLVARLEDDLKQLRRQAEAEAQARQNEVSLHQERAMALEQERTVALARCHEVETRSSQQEREHLDTLRLAEQRVSTLQIEKVQETARLNSAIAELQLRLDTAAQIHSKEADAGRALLDRLEGEKAQALSARSDTQARLNQHEEKHREALRLADQRYAALHIEKVEEGARLAAVAAEWQSRFEAAAQVSVTEARRVEANNALLTSRLTDEVEHFRRQAEAAAALSSKETSTLAERLSELERENTALLGERAESQTRWREAQENQAESRRRAEQRASDLEAERIEEAGWLRAALAESQARIEAASFAHNKESAAQTERLSLIESERVAAMGERDALETRLREQQERQGAALRSAEEAASSTLREKTEETFRLKATVAEWQSRFDAAASTSAKESQRLETGHVALVARLKEEVEQLRRQSETVAMASGKEASALAERLLELEREKTALLSERNELQTRSRKEQENQGEALRRAEQRISEVQSARAEEVAKLGTAVAEWQSRFDAAAKGAANEVLRLEAGHVALMNRLQAEADQLRKEGRAAAESQKLEVRGFAERVSALESEKAKALGESGAREGRLAQMEASHRDALRLLEERNASEQREHVEKVSRVNAAFVEAQSRLDAGTKAAAKEAQRLETQRAAEVRQFQAELKQTREKAEAAARQHATESARLSERLSGFERASSSSALEREAVEARLRQAEESHREATRLTEARLFETEARLRSTEERLNAAAETSKANADETLKMRESLRAALARRALESAAHAAAIDSREAHRAAQEARITALARTVVEAGSPSQEEPRDRSIPPFAKAGGAPEFDESLSVEDPPPTAGAGESDDSAAKSSERETRGPLELAPWEYERILRGRKEKKTKMQNWLKGVARRVRWP